MTGRADLAAPGVAGDAARRASGFAVAVLCLLLVTRISDAISAGQRGQVPLIVALFVVPMLYAFPGTRRLLDRYRWQALAAQAALTWVPFALFGSGWNVGVGGLLAGLVLLMVPGPVSWLLAGGLAVADAAVRAIVTGLPVTPAWFAVVYVVVYYVDDALVFFGLVRLAQIVGEVQQARAQAAELAVARERLQAAEGLQAAVGERLAGVAAQAAAARRALPRHAEQARAQIAAAGVAAREAVAQARTVTTGWRAPALPEPAEPPGAATGAVMAPRLAWAVVVAVLSAFAVDNVASVIVFHYGARLTAVAVADIVVVTALQLYQSRPAPGGGRPRGWPVTLALQAALVYAFVLPSVHAYIGALAPFLAGSLLLLVPGRWRWAGYAAVVASVPVLSVTLALRGFAMTAGQRVPSALVFAASIAGVGLAVYGLSWLARLAVQLEALRSELARMAVVQERLRIARDVHDLLGLGLSAIALKADLIGRLIGRDDTRAAAEILEMSRICAAARADIRLVTAEGQRLSLATELAAARQILGSAGIEVRACLAEGRLPAGADEVLAPVLREAVTNILRHSTATICMIDVTVGDGRMRLRVGNDGLAGVPDTGGRAGGPAGDTRAGSGLANLTARVQAAGGWLTSRRADGWFDLVAEIPLRAVPQ